MAFRGAAAADRAALFSSPAALSFSQRWFSSENPARCFFPGGACKALVYYWLRHENALPWSSFNVVVTCFFPQACIETTYF